MTPPPRLPLRPLSAEETTGFRLALACMATWGRQMRQGAVSLAGDRTAAARMDHSGRVLEASARALDITLGQPARAPGGRATRLAAGPSSLS